MIDDPIFESGPVDLLCSNLDKQIRLSLDVCGATCQAYKLFYEGRHHFQKVLRPEQLQDEHYRELLRKEFNPTLTL